jgi:hypothetical protein
MRRLIFCLLACAISPAAHAQVLGAPRVPVIQEIRTRQLDMNSPGQCRDFSQDVITQHGIFCAITGVGGGFAGAGEFGAVTLVNNTWKLIGHSCQPGTFVRVTCFQVVMCVPGVQTC